MNADDLRRLARLRGVDVATLEKDYALSWLIYGIYSEASQLRDLLVFKGGTAMRKVYFPEWRLSEDLDFTLDTNGTSSGIETRFKRTLVKLKELSGISYSLKDFNEQAFAIFGSIQFIGPFQYGNRISLDISTTEKLVTPPEKVTSKLGYDEIPQARVLVYSIDEILVEKIRSLFQRTKARDYYDVWRLLRNRNFDLPWIRSLLIKKCKLTNVPYNPHLIFERTRLDDVRRYWEIALERLTYELPPFEEVAGELNDSLKFLLS